MEILLCRAWHVRRCRSETGHVTSTVYVTKGSSGEFCWWLVRVPYVIFGRLLATYFLEGSCAHIHPAGTSDESDICERFF